jgi:hypothetical protein
LGPSRKIRYLLQAQHQDQAIIILSKYHGDGVDVDVWDNEDHGTLVDVWDYQGRRVEVWDYQVHGVWDGVEF